MKKALKDRITGIILTALSLVLTVGVKTFFSACGPKDDGSFMTCHWAEQAVFAAGLALTLMSVFVLIVGADRAGIGASVSVIVLGCVTIMIPGMLINLCMMTQMHCHTVMRPAVTVVCALVIVTAAVHTFLQLKKRRTDR